MKSRKIQVLTAFAIGAVCLYLFARKVENWPAVWSAMLETHYGYFFLAVVLSANSILIRAFRWQWLLGEPYVPVNRLFLIANIGFMGNGVFPARMGELIRPFLVWRFTPHAFPTALATIVVERIYDLLGLLLILAYVFYVFPFPAAADPAGDNPRDTIQYFAQLGVMVFLVLFGAIAVMTYAPEWSLKAARRIFQPLPKVISEKLLQAVESFEQGANTFRKPKAFLYCLAWTLALWLSIAFSELVILWAMGITQVGLAGALFLMVGLCFAVMFPQAPGYLGPYQFAVQLILAKTFLVDSGQATAAAWIMWLSQVPPVILLGFVSLLVLGVSFQEIARVQEEIPRGAPASPAPPGGS
ncbi:MAG: lysylphosphatidylglycerol synthase transmembrane domain-containing protein [bacterium]